MILITHPDYNIEPWQVMTKTQSITKRFGECQYKNSPKFRFIYAHYKRT